jgi:hypothetical protein
MVIQQKVKISFKENEFMIIKELIKVAKLHNLLLNKLLVRQLISCYLDFAIKIKGRACEVSIKIELRFSDHLN